MSTAPNFMRERTPTSSIDQVEPVTGRPQWRFWIDRGGTFTDVVGRDPRGCLHLRKVLSNNAPDRTDPAVLVIQQFLSDGDNPTLDPRDIAEVRIGTTVATNALLERTGEPTLLVLSRGMRDALIIGDQSRPDIFALEICRPQPLHTDVIEVAGRIDVDGKLIEPLDEAAAASALREALDAGMRSVAFALMHANRFPEHERQLGEIARRVGFRQVLLSHEISIAPKLLPRAETTVQNAYLSPPLRKYLEGLSERLPSVPLRVMRSDGGLTDIATVRGVDTILSGPAAGVVACAATAMRMGFPKVIGFDMGGTSTDVCHYAGELERGETNSSVAGVRIHVPMVDVHTVAAGGGSVLKFDGQRFQVGPESAGADPGPACYGRGGPLTLTDCNLLLGKLRPELFPPLFGKDGKQPLDRRVVEAEFWDLAAKVNHDIGKTMSSEEIAHGFLRIGVDNMAHAIKRVSTAKGHDVRDYALNCFGGAGAQHACLVAEAAGIRTVLVHRFASVLSAYGIGLSTLTATRSQTVTRTLTDSAIVDLQSVFVDLEEAARTVLIGQGADIEAIVSAPYIHLKYSGTDALFQLSACSPSKLRTELSALHKKRFGFDTPERALTIERVTVEVHEDKRLRLEDSSDHEGVDDISMTPLMTADVFFSKDARKTPVFDLDRLGKGLSLDGPCIIANHIATIVVEPGWAAIQSEDGQLVLSNTGGPKPVRPAADTEFDPILLELFNNSYMSVAEQMGDALAKTARSINIRERLDFSCAVFDESGNLIANAPHVPVHLGSMSDSVRDIIQSRGGSMRPRDAYMLNDPYTGGTHLPDITVITPVFARDATDGAEAPLFFLASRAHHADIGGLTPGSMPSSSQHIDEEGVLIRDFHLVEEGSIREDAVIDLLSSARFPARDPQQNLADLKAQVAANERGKQELHKLLSRYGEVVVAAYAAHLQDYAEEQTRRAIDSLSSGSFEVKLDNGSQISLSVQIDRARREANLSFSGTSPKQRSNYNAPRSITNAAILYVFRTLLEVDIPLNEGCLRPINTFVEEGSMLDPEYPTAVVAGNVEVSQSIVDCLYGALGRMAAAQGTMNNITFGTDSFQHYETICGGAGAGPGFNGASAVHTHMTNSRLTDPEVLERSVPVLLEEFSIISESGGVGRWRGGDGVRRKLRFREAMTVSLLANRHIVPPFGLAGGGCGRVGKAWIDRADGSEIHLSSADQSEVRSGDVLTIETPGGGGYGPTDGGTDIADPVSERSVPERSVTEPSANRRSSRE